VVKIPDSLRSEFKTENGRVVLDGGGIDPDIESPSEQAGDLVLALFQQYHFFDFATEYYRQNAEIAPAQEYKVDEQVFNQFTAWLSKRDFDFDTRTGRLLNRMEEAARADGFGEALQDEIDRLRAAYEAEKKQEISKQKLVIMELLQEEIVARYYFDSGRLANALGHDKDIALALEYLQDQEKYNAILNP